MAEIQWKGAIFDLDGTLLDSMGVWSQVDIDFLKKRSELGEVKAEPRRL